MGCVVRKGGWREGRGGMVARPERGLKDLLGKF